MLEVCRLCRRIDLENESELRQHHAITNTTAAQFLGSEQEMNCMIVGSLNVTIDHMDFERSRPVFVFCRHFLDILWIS